MEELKKFMVLGTGNMGPGIALQFARAGYEVWIWGPDEKYRQEGISHFAENVGDLVREGIMDPGEAAMMGARVKVTTSLEMAAGVQMVVEAIPEELELKQEMYRRLEELCPEDCIIASNTSTLLPAALSEGMQHPERFLVAHFWNPAYLAPLVEVCGSKHTLPGVKDAVMAILRKIGNEPVLMKKEIQGYIGNRIMHAMNREALALIGAGVCSAADIDRVVLGSFGPRFAHLGPMEYLDFSGMDLIRNIQSYLYGDLDHTPGVLPVVEKLVAEGKLGLKSGQGLFDWSKKENRIRENRDKEFIRRRKEVS